VLYSILQEIPKEVKLPVYLNRQLFEKVHLKQIKSESNKYDVMKIVIKLQRDLLIFVIEQELQEYTKLLKKLRCALLISVIEPENQE